MDPGHLAAGLKAELLLRAGGSFARGGSGLTCIFQNDL